jgi:hypothetical protein
MLGILPAASVIIASMLLLTAAGAQETRSQLQMLQEMYKEGLISKDVYEQKQRAILDTGQNGPPSAGRSPGPVQPVDIGPTNGATFSPPPSSRSAPQRRTTPIQIDWGKLPSKFTIENIRYDGGQQIFFDYVAKVDIDYPIGAYVQVNFFNEKNINLGRGFFGFDPDRSARNYRFSKGERGTGSIILPVSEREAETFMNKVTTIVIIGGG